MLQLENVAYNKLKTIACRTTLGGLTRWLSLQKIRWVRRNVLYAYEVGNISLTQYLQDKINESSGIF